MVENIKVLRLVVWFLIGRMWVGGVIVVVVVHPRNLIFGLVEIWSVTAEILLTLSLCGWVVV